MRGDRARFARRPQPHIHVVEPSFGGGSGDRTDQSLAQPREISCGRQWLRAVGSLAAGRDVIDQDQIQIGGEGHLAAAEAAHPDHRETASRHPAVAVRELGFHPRQQRGERSLRDIGQRCPGLRAVEGAAQQLDSDLKPSFTGPAPQPIERIFEIPHTRHDLIKLGGETGEIR